jgi:hypothetical protein
MNGRWKLAAGMLAATAALQWGAAAAAAPPAFVPVAGADAEVLEHVERFELQEDGRVAHEVRTRLAVNSYVAINRLYGETTVVWDPRHDEVQVLANRTVLPSGEVVEAPANAVVDDLPQQVHRNPLWSHLRRRVVVHTALEPGAVIECAYRVTSHGAAWLEAEVPLRRALPVRSLTVEVEVSADAPLLWQVSPGTVVTPEDRLQSGRRLLRFHLEELPALPEEPGSPPRDEMVPYLWLSTAPAGGAQEELARRLAAAGPLPAEAAKEVARAMEGKASFEERVLAVLETLREGVQVSEEAGATLVRASLAPLSQVWESGWATPLELAALGSAALDSIGVDATVGLVGKTGRDGARVPGFVGFDRPVVLFADQEGCLRLVDPVAPGEGGPLEEVVRERAVLTALPRPTASPCARASAAFRRQVTASLQVDEAGAISGEVELATGGAAVPHAALVHGGAKVASAVAALVPGGKAGKSRVVNLSRRSAAVVVEVTGALPPPDPAGLVRVSFGEAPQLAGDPLPPLPVAGRLTPMLLGGPGEEALEVTVRLAPGWSVAALPVPVAVENAAGSVTVRLDQGAGGEVHLERRLVLRSRVVPAEAAGAVRALLAAWRSPASQELLLRPPQGGERQGGSARTSSGGGR